MERLFNYLEQNSLFLKMVIAHVSDGLSGQLNAGVFVNPA
jgi:hypothetical protein